MNPTQDEREAEELLESAAGYHSLASKYFYLELAIDPAEHAGTEWEEIAREISGEPLPPGLGWEDASKVHFLFPNLPDKTRDLLTRFIYFRAEIEKRRGTEKFASLVQEFGELKRRFQANTERRLTSMQMLIVEKLLPEIRD